MPGDVDRPHSDDMLDTNKTVCGAIGRVWKQYVEVLFLAMSVEAIK